MCFAVHIEEPPLPHTAQNALLHMLIDRYLVFQVTNQPLRTKNDLRPLDENAWTNTSTRCA